MIENSPSSYIIFTSRATQLMTVEGLNEMQCKTYQANQLASITGMLLYMEIRLIDKLEGRFMQLIEGNESKIQLLYKKIGTDHRHDNILLLASGKQSAANFSNWSMSYSGQPLEQLGFKLLEDTLFDGETFQEGNGPAYFLKTFYNYNVSLQKEYAIQNADFLSPKTVLFI